MAAGGPRYSICITTKNDVGTVDASLSSLFSELPEASEVVVVDSKSADGTSAKLEGYATERKIILLEQECTRGRGRQLAFERSTGDYVVAGVDTDDTIRKGALREALRLYHERFEGKIMKADNIYIGARRPVASVGWRDLYAGEDHDFGVRAKEAGLLVDSELKMHDARRMRTYHGIERFEHHVRLFWAYAGLGKRPVTSWRSEPLWQVIRILRKLVPS